MLDDIDQLEEACAWMQRKDVELVVDTFRKELRQNPNNDTVQALLERAEEILAAGEYALRWLSADLLNAYLVLYL